MIIPSVRSESGDLWYHVMYLSKLSVVVARARREASRRSEAHI